ncbi:hypothetical protein Zmor_007085 [Zophobas morio]|uniref:Carboxylic ester hydrolase n=1 Tax=Zophobas morio TaxID=2755281 RepID=A0AA38IUZ6_9CUCU|nr:hypothetical protein Zmor_007085 [Zophobas morio]
MKYSVLALYFICSCTTLQVNKNPLVHLPNGSIFGLQSTTLHGKTYYVFEKVPYAAPPIGKLRFQKPQPSLSWNGTLNCTYLDVMCYQLNPVSDLKLSEDCLYLNIYTPQVPSENANISLPVMFYIHGGGFVDGYGGMYGPDFFMHEDVILVTINYRLGPFGFLSTQDGVIPGNNGLKDQQLSLQWVHRHISLFGGDPHKVTVFGHSAGSASVGYHLLNPKSQGLFWAAICQSGSPLGPWAYQRWPRKAAFKLASILNNTVVTNSSEELLNFLQGVTGEEIYEAGKIYNNYIFNGSSEDVPSLEGMNWAPTLEIDGKDAFISKKMYGLIESGEVITVPLLMGFTTEENLNFHLDKQEVKKTMQMYDDDLANLVPVDMEIEDMSLRKEMGRLIRNMYTGGAPFSKRLGTGIKFSSDNDMTRPIMKQAELLSKYSKVYFYVFSFHSRSGMYHVSYDGAEKVGHGEELLYLFCLRIYDKCDFSGRPKSDQVTRKRLVKVWSDFAKFRNPSPQISDLLQNISWPQLTVREDTFPYVDIGENITIKNYPNKDLYIKWNKLYDSLNRDDLFTY